MSVQLIKIPCDKEGIFLERENKYLAAVKVDNNIIKVHIHDPGRLKELLYPGNKVLLKYEAKPTRKTDYDLIAAWKNNHWVLVHSGYHRKIAEKIFEKKLINLFSSYESVEPEQSIKLKDHTSRIDFKLSNKNSKLWVEVKGCTLTKDGVALFPDAPTKRGSKHLKTLIEIKNRGDNAALLILVFRKDSKCFKPNNITDPEFSKIFINVINKDIKIIPVLLRYEGNYILFEKILPLCNLE